MDSKDRSKAIPLGTFAPSTPPPAPDESVADDIDDVGEPDNRGQSPAGSPVAEELPAAARPNYARTLVGHPSVSARAAAANEEVPLVAPPRWRGAGAYLEGQEPQLRVSSAAPMVSTQSEPPLPASDPRGKPVTRVQNPPPPPRPASQIEAQATAQSPVTAPVPQSGGDQGPQPGSAGSAASQVSGSEPPPETLGAAIEELLDGQAAVPFMDEESRETSLRMAVSLEEAIEGFAHPDSAPPPVISRPSSTRAAEPAAEVGVDADADTHADTHADTEVAPEAAPASSEDVFAGASEAAAAPSIEVDLEVPVAPRPGVVSAERREPVPVVSAARAVSIPEQAASSLAPAEVPPEFAPAGDGSSGMGALMVAAIVVLGVGGWYLTRGTYQPAPRSQAAPVAAPASAPSPTMGAHPVPPSGIAAAPAAAAQPAAVTPEARPAEAVAPGTSAATTPTRTAPGPSRPSAPARSDSSSEPRSPQGAGALPADEGSPAPVQPILKVSPRPVSGSKVFDPKAAAGALPDAPSKTDVKRALEGLRGAIGRCAAGQGGVAELDLTIASGGVVTHALVGGDFSGTSAGSCIARVVRGARFSPFKQPRFRVIYPFSL
ncbi:MAG: hypothetical protein OEZ06_21250 [Myxococcales bacterium]|nr:hypothetical protein [Myxococcales bacterium]